MHSVQRDLAIPCTKRPSLAQVRAPGERLPARHRGSLYRDALEEFRSNSDSTYVWPVQMTVGRLSAAEITSREAVLPLPWEAQTRGSIGGS
jgi:hypothetical protein